MDDDVDDDVDDGVGMDDGVDDDDDDILTAVRYYRDITIYQINFISIHLVLGGDALVTPSASSRHILWSIHMQPLLTMVANK